MVAFCSFFSLTYVVIVCVCVCVFIFIKCNLYSLNARLHFLQFTVMYV